MNIGSGVASLMAVISSLLVRRRESERGEYVRRGYYDPRSILIKLTIFLMMSALTKENDIVLTSAHMAVDQVLMGEALAIHQPCHRRRDACMCVFLAIWISRQPIPFRS
jgi:hypothetical protein